MTKLLLQAMLLRLLLGLVKGLVIGGLLGFALAKIGMAAPGAVVGYLAAALAGALVGLVAGKPIWAQGGKIEAGLKAGFGALLAVGLMWLSRKFLTFGVPVNLGSLAAANHSLQQTSPTMGGLAITSLPMVTALLGAFYDADNTPDPDAKSDAKQGAAGGAAKAGGAKGARIDATNLDDLDEDFGVDEDVPGKKQNKR